MVSPLEIHAPRPCAPRGRASTALMPCVTVLALLGCLAACGGSSSPPPPPPAPSGPMDAVLAVPAPMGYDADRLAAFDRLNAIRLSAGLGMLAQQPLMDRAAQAHADWEIANDTYGHVEMAGTPGFTGAHWWDRDEAIGYAPVGGGEVAASGYAAVDAVNAFVNVAYHRVAVLEIEPVDVGIGRSSQSTSNVRRPVVVDIAVPQGDPVRGQGQLAQTLVRGVVVWPVDGAANVSTHMGDEAPNPVPGADVLALGTPASITVARSRTIQVTTFSLTNTATGAAVPAHLLTHLTDINGLVPVSYLAVIPLAPLDADAAYTAAFEGSILEPDSNTPTPLVRVWNFSTGPT
jgi:uncharacterized protein YkwD